MERVREGKITIDPLASEQFRKGLGHYEQKRVAKALQDEEGELSFKPEKKFRLKRVTAVLHLLGLTISDSNVDRHGKKVTVRLVPYSPISLVLDQAERILDQTQPIAELLRAPRFSAAKDKLALVG